MTIELIEKNITSIEPLVQGEYWGRAIIVGRTPDEKYDVAAYFPTGRSPGSRARFLELNETNGMVDIVPSTDAKPGQGNPALIYYTALDLLDNGNIVISNGAQTNHIFKIHQRLRNQGTNPEPLDLLMTSFENGPVMMDNFYQDEHGNLNFKRIDLTSFEPDYPTNTPRISAVLGQDQAAMCIIFSNHGQAERQYFNFPLNAGQARMLPTYTGENVESHKPIPHFSGSPLEIPLTQFGPGELTHQIYDSLGPKEGAVISNDDLRVGVVSVFRDRNEGELFFNVKNKYERGK